MSDTSKAKVAWTWAVRHTAEWLKGSCFHPSVQLYELCAWSEIKNIFSHQVKISEIPSQRLSHWSAQLFPYVLFQRSFTWSGISGSTFNFPGKTPDRFLFNLPLDKALCRSKGPHSGRCVLLSMAKREKQNSSKVLRESLNNQALNGEYKVCRNISRRGEAQHSHTCTLPLGNDLDISPTRNTKPQLCGQALYKHSKTLKKHT